MGAELWYSREYLRESFEDEGLGCKFWAVAVYNKGVKTFHKSLIDVRSIECV